MGRWVGAFAVACALAVSVSTAVVPARAESGLLVGVDDDTAKWMTRPNGLVATYDDLGLGAVRVTIPWRRGRSRPNPVVGLYLHRVALMIARGERVVLAVYGTPSQAPLDRRERRGYCGFVAGILERLPITDVVIWNEANSPTFWPQTAGARAYEALLATCWDRLHGLRPDVNVISSTASHYDAAGFVRALGDAYRESGRTRPIVDTFGHNPYPAYAAELPSATHQDGSTTGEGDLDRLLDAYRAAFEGTAQPIPGTRQTTIWYLEDGFQTLVPHSKIRYYRGVESDPSALPAAAPQNDLTDVRDQATQLRDALLLAYCQPAVGAFFNFELIDEDRLSGWQSGLLWRDGTHKPSYDAFRSAVSLVRSGSVDCSTVAGSRVPGPADRVDQLPLAHLGTALDAALPRQVAKLLPVPVL